MISAGLLLSVLVAEVRADDFLGRWESAWGTVVEFGDDGTFLNSGIDGAATYKKCAEGNGNLCVAGRDYVCRYRARYEADRMVLQLLTGRPTRNCPEGVFRKRG